MPFIEAIDSLMAREPTLIPDGASFKFNEYLRVFAISKVARLDIIQDTQKALKKALEQGLSAQQFLKANPNLVSKIGKKRLARVFAHNLIYANTRGKMLRYESAPPIQDSSDGDGWYFVFHSRHDSRARHLEFDGICLPRKHALWKTHTPPLDWGCRCELQMWSERQIKAKGIEVTKNPPKGSAKEPGHFEPDAPTFIKNLLSSKRQSYKDNPQALKVLDKIDANAKNQQALFERVAPAFLKNTLLHLGKLAQANCFLDPKTFKKLDAFDAFLALEAMQDKRIKVLDKMAYFFNAPLQRWYQLDLTEPNTTILKRIPKGPVDLKIEQLAKLQEGEDDQQAQARILKALEFWQPILNLNDKQDRHMQGNKNYTLGRGYYEAPLDADRVKPLFKHGKFLWTMDGDWDKKIVITHPDFYGVHVPNGDLSQAKKTHKSKVHFANDGFHMVPYMSKDKEK
ncbi:hypothetical protein NHP190003_13350 [Helicobacter sp. NHP19-003]|uniref:Phage head morphogenesis domain-containing protein n=1 Tax=Helicobacter gastrocanis TaxID=2849641 RepID=A0ABN6I3C3_9HELI|nr:polymorphic toxin type 50 domain-containing protein [Helicobacter sp. NHP19-003]BCZ18053.1 hypothetical protein NHP190003_13350 [Helicobacter sp. NHP19-003]